MRRLVLLTFSAVVVVAAVGFMPGAVSTAMADTPKQEICSGIGLAGGNCNDTGSQLNDVLSAIINLLSIIIGVAATVVIMVAGLRFITSGGDAAKVAGAKNTVIYALIGLVIVVLAQFIVRFVLTAVS